MEPREEARWQAGKLRVYLAGGGSWVRWWKSKDFEPAFRKMVRSEFSKQLREDMDRDPIRRRNSQIVEWAKYLGGE